ncbi:hypothetical protein C1J03_24935 (plasmid) [Sulfitobacter sp. SK012]|nr:FAD-dependent oxidoreductase [Sulfitobacter sp. SK012]AXI49353.1 hypothetical protein C1J03_24935 [Sulfitobacter sp. SK012]
MKADVQVAVVGGGIVGASVLYWLAKMGWTDSLLIESRELTSGSTWHAAGNTTYFGPYAAMTPLFADQEAMIEGYGGKAVAATMGAPSATPPPKI